MAVVPLLWVLPLSLYLLSFVVCFIGEGVFAKCVVRRSRVGCTFVCFALYQSNFGVGWQILIYAFTLFACCMVCHGELAQLKPAKEFLTSFYLLVAAGGALGGVFVSIIAPTIFRGFWNFILVRGYVAVLSCLMLLRDTASWIYLPTPFLLAFSALAVFVGPGLAAIGWKPLPLQLFFTRGGRIPCFDTFRDFSGTSSVGTGDEQQCSSISFTALLLAVILASRPLAAAYRAVATARNFYGVLTVVTSPLISKFSGG